MTYARSSFLIGMFVVLLAPYPAFSQVSDEIDQAIEVFSSECPAMMNDPEAFLSERRKLGDAGPYLIRSNEDRSVYSILRMNQAEILNMEIGEVNGVTHLSCSYSIFLDPSNHDPISISQAALSVIEENEGVTPVGGPVEVSGILAQNTGMPQTNYDYLIHAFDDQIVSITIQGEMLRLDAERILPRPLSISD